MDNSNPNNDVEDFDLDEIFEEISTQGISESFKEYCDSLSEFYQYIHVGSRSTLVRAYEDFNFEELSESDTRFVTDALRVANYEPNALRSENVVLFNEPVILSEIICSSGHYGENEGALRLISYLTMDKKVTTRRKTNLKKAEVTYEVYDLVSGIILPRRCKFIGVRLATYKSLHTDYKKLERTQKALNNAVEIPLIEFQNWRKKAQDINSMLQMKSDEFKSLADDINVLEHQKSHLETSISRSQSALEDIRSDRDEVSKEYEYLTYQYNEQNSKLISINEKLNTSKKLYKEEEDRLKGIKEESATQSVALQSIKREIADAKREKNLTTFDTIGHSKETGRQLRGYYGLAILLLLGLGFMALYIYTNGQKISSLLPYLVHVSSWDILLSRLPLVAATTLIIGGITGALFYLIKHIILLNTEKMIMLKAGILAEQITNSLDCKGMSEQEILEFKRDTKIKLIMQIFSKNESVEKQSNIVLEVLKAVNANKG
ncbi:TPA: hypothetical protein ACPHT1_001644 [Vibrio antiquarius]